VFVTADGPVSRTLMTAAGAGLVDVSVIPHLDNPNHPDASMVNAEKWAARIAAPTYAIDDQTALRVVDGVIDVVSEGAWRLFPP
jgi:dipeptidase E